MDKPLPPDYSPKSLVSTVRQSSPINLEIPYDANWLRGKTVLITGGASGFGAAFVRRWAASGACVVFGDINVEGGDKLARQTRKETGNENVHFIHCNVCDWQSQVNFFKEAIKLSPHHGIDVVVPNAGIAVPDDYEQPIGLDAAEPPKPNFKTFEVNMVGVLYTVHLAIFYLARNPGSKLCSASSNPATTPRDRCILLIGSMASLGPIPGQPQYAVSKHGVLGLFRTLRSTSFVHGIRINLLCPYFVDTAIVTGAARALLAGSGVGKPQDVVEAGTRLVADTRIIGRSLYVGPRMQLVEDEEGRFQLATKSSKGQREVSIWEPYAEDFGDSEAFGRNLTRLLNQFVVARGWVWWFADMVKAAGYGLGFGR